MPYVIMMAKDPGGTAMRSLFQKTKWDPYMDGIEIRPRLHTWPEKIIFIVSVTVLAASLLLLILPSHEAGVFDPDNEQFWTLRETETVEDQLIKRTFEAGEIYRLTGPYPADDEKRYTERWEMEVTLKNARTKALPIFLGPENKSAGSRAITFRQGTREFSGNWLAKAPEIVRGQRGRLVAADDNPYFNDFYLSIDNPDYFNPNYEALARMVTNTVISRKAAMWRYLAFAGLLAFASMVLTYIYNEIFILQRALMSFSYHRSEDIEPTGLYTFGHFLATALISGFALIFFLIYLF